ncbi:MAG: N-acetylmuramoyl-L-alanine amidase family protein, partial [Candidatus Binataceae bacterium]
MTGGSAVGDGVGVSAAARRITAIVAICAVAILMAPASRAATVTGVTLENHGKVVELHFAYRGRGLQWRLSTHGQELWIDLERTQLQLTPRPLFGHETAQIQMVRTVDPGGGHCRIIVQVEGKTDYAIAALRHELVLRLAPAGQVPDLAAPILVRMEHRPLRRRAPSATMRAAGGSHTAYRVARSATHAKDGAAANRTQIAQAPAASAENNHAAPVVASADANHFRTTAYTVGHRLPAHPLVMIDPGHGGHDPGTEAGGGYAEKTLSLEIALRLEKALLARGINAKMT